MKKSVIITISAIVFVVFLGLLPRMCGQIKHYEPITKYDLPSEEGSFRLRHIVADGDTLDIYDGTSDYARVASKDPIPHEKLLRMGRELEKKFEPRIIYFHVNGDTARGDEYAVYQSGTLFDYRMKDLDKAAVSVGE